VISHPEAALQRQLVGFLGWALPEGAWFTAIAHGAGRGGTGDGWLRGAIWKGMGARAGCPDLLVLYQGRAFFGEVKAPKGQLSIAQQTTHTALRAAGCPVAVWKSLDDLQASLTTWGIPTRLSKSEHIARGFANAGEGPVNWPEGDPVRKRRRRVNEI
jgi:hypothetical protein